MSDCPTTERLASYYDKELPPPLADEVLRHLGECRACAERLEEYRSLSELFRTPVAQPLTPMELARLHLAVDRSDDRGVLRIAVAMSALAASVLIVSSVWLYDVPRPPHSVSFGDDAETGWERLATTGRFDAPAGAAETGLARDRSTVDWMLAGMRGQAQDEND